MMRAYLQHEIARLQILAHRAWKAWDNLGSTRNGRHRAVEAPVVRVRPRASDKQWSRIAAMTL